MQVSWQCYVKIGYTGGINALTMYPSKITWQYNLVHNTETVGKHTGSHFVWKSITNLPCSGQKSFNLTRDST